MRRKEEIDELMESFIEETFTTEWQCSIDELHGILSPAYSKRQREIGGLEKEFDTDLEEYEKYDSVRFFPEDISNRYAWTLGIISGAAEYLVNKGAVLPAGAPVQIGDIDTSVIPDFEKTLQNVNECYERAYNAMEEDDKPYFEKFHTKNIMTAFDSIDYAFIHGYEYIQGLLRYTGYESDGKDIKKLYKKLH